MPMSKGYFGYKNMIHGIYLLYKNEGFYSFFRGKDFFFWLFFF